MRQTNHPKKGDSTKVDPIRSERDIKNIKKLLADNPRNLCIFVVGINTNLRASDLVRLTVGQIKYVPIGGSFNMREKKTGKLRTITMNRTVYDAVQNLLKTMPEAKDHEPIFQSRKGKQPLCVSYLSYLVKNWCKQINLKGNFGSHSLRKTMGYMHRTVFNTDIPLLMTMFNHSTQKQTLSYLGIQETDVQNAYLREI